MKKTTQYRVSDAMTFILAVCTVGIFVLAGMAYYIDGFISGMMGLAGLCGMFLTYLAFEDTKDLKDEIEKEKRDRRNRYYSLQKD